MVELNIPVPPKMSDLTSLVDAPRLWRQNAGGTDTSVTILDTGVRPIHAACGNSKIVGSAGHSLNESGTSTSLCPDGQDGQVTRDRPRTGADRDTSISGCGHGTHVAASAAGRMGGNHGAARGADIFSLQVFSRFTSSGYSDMRPPPCRLAWNFDQIKSPSG